MLFRIFKKIILVLVILIVAVLYFIVVVGFNKGTKHIDAKSYRYNAHTKEIIVEGEHSMYIKFYESECGSYGLIGVLIPVFPYWKNEDCNSTSISVDGSIEKVYILHNNQSYSEYRYEGFYKKYIFKVSPKVFKDGAILVMETNNKILQVPFKYQHTFFYGVSYQMWGRNKESNE